MVSDLGQTSGLKAKKYKKVPKNKATKKDKETNVTPQENTEENLKARDERIWSKDPHMTKRFQAADIMPKFSTPGLKEFGKVSIDDGKLNPKGRSLKNSM